MTAPRGAAIDDLIVDHNTAIPGGYSTYYVEAATAPAIVRFRMTNNILGFGSFGVTFPKADAALAKWLPGAIVARNALVNLADTADGQGPARNVRHEISQTMYMSFASAAAAGLNPDGTLTPKSPNRRTGTDGKDVGVDFDELQRAMMGQSSRR